MHARCTIAKTYWTALAITLAVPGPGSSTSGQTGQLDVVDERIEDVSPLAVSLHDARLSLRQPADFGRVYRFQDDSNRLFRAQGGLYAVFPRSVYVADKDGNVFPIVPPDTLFYIGPPPGLTASTELRAHVDRIDGHIESRVAPGLVSAAIPLQPLTEPSRHRSVTHDAASTVTPAAGILHDADYRARRLAALMQVAANARRSVTPHEDRRPRRRSTPGTPASEPATPSGD